MLATQSDIFDVPNIEAVILTVRDVQTIAIGAMGNRLLYFENLTADTLSVQIQENSGSGWVDLGGPFSVGAIGSGSEIVWHSIDSVNPFRIQAQGGGDDTDLVISYTRAYATDSVNWTAPMT